jgi:hypothetical protein
MTPYAELLRDPRWQRKRLEVMERDGFACVECRSTTRTLNVHHRYYERGAAPWEYPDAAFVTLCEDCHERVERELAAIRRTAGFLSAREREALFGFLYDLWVEPQPTPVQPKAANGPRRAQWKMLNDGPMPPLPQ